MHPSNRARALVFGLIAALAASPVLADKPEWAGKGKGHDRHEDRDDQGDKHGKKHFSEQHRVAVHDYYVREFESGHGCPPGLAKKHNGCMPPGQAKKWQIGKPLPREVVRYDLPPAVIVQIGAPPPGYQYVRVASDILLIAAGSAIVADAIKDLGRM